MKMVAHKKLKIIIHFITIIVIILSSIIIFTWTKPDYTPSIIIHRFGPNNRTAIQIYDDPSHYKFLTLSSGSMFPTIRPGDTVLSVSTDLYGVENITSGNIIVFYSNGDKVCHRVTDVRPDGLTTKGDGNDNPDNWIVHREDILGVVIGIFWSNQ